MFGGHNKKEENHENPEKNEAGYQVFLEILNFSS